MAAYCCIVTGQKCTILSTSTAKCQMCIKCWASGVQVKLFVELFTNKVMVFQLPALTSGYPYSGLFCTPRQRAHEGTLYLLQFQGYIYKMLQAKSEEEVNQLGNALENNLEVGTSAQLFLDKALGIHSPVHPSCKCGVIQFCAMEARS